MTQPTILNRVSNTERERESFRACKSILVEEELVEKFPRRAADISTEFLRDFHFHQFLPPRFVDDTRQLARDFTHADRTGGYPNFGFSSSSFPERDDSSL